VSTSHHEEILLNLFDEVTEEFPYLEEDDRIDITNQRFEELCQ
tara:strand:+ start:714 stop:842 length:129 start_codon:yes stop_codon:yes gene_type:complete